MFRNLALGLVCVGLAASFSPAVASEPVQAAADAVLAAFQADDDAALADAAGAKEPDPWLVGDALCARGAFDAAAAFAKRIRPRERDALVAYVTSQREAPTGRATRVAHSKVLELMGRRRWEEAVALVKDVSSRPASVTTEQLAALQAIALERAGRGAEGVEAMLAAARIADALGWLHDAFARRYEAGHMTMRLQDLERAAGVWRETLAAAEKAGYDGPSGEVAMRLAQVLDYRGDLAGAVQAGEQALRVFRRLKHPQYVAMALGMLGIFQTKLGNYDEALALQEQALAMQEQSGDKRSAAMTLGNLAAIHRGKGDIQKALEMGLEALARRRELGLRGEVAKSLASLGEVYRSVGDYARAIRFLDEALALHGDLDDQLGMAYTLGRLGSVYGDLRDFDKAFSYQRRALALFEEIGAVSRIAEAREGLAGLHDGVGHPAEAVELYRLVLAQREKEGDAGRISDTLMNLCGALSRAGKVAEALPFGERALALAEKTGDALDQAYAWTVLGDAYGLQGEYAKATRHLAKALKAAEGSEDRRLITAIHETRVEAADRAGKHADAVAAARAVAKALPYYLRHLADEEHARASERWVRCLATGAAAAVRLGRAGDAFFLLEAGRASALREALGGERALHAAIVPASLLDAEARAHADEVKATEALREAVKTRASAKAQAELRAALERARQGVEAVVERIQRELKTTGDVVHPSPIPLEHAQAALRAGDVLVLYALQAARATAVVVTSASVRALDLGPSETIVALCSQILSDRKGTINPEAVRRLSQAVIAPLHLEKNTRRLLVAPDGGLGYVPVTLLAPGKEVAFVPSATTLALLATADGGSAAAEKVLALGNPTYGDAKEGRTPAAYRSGMDLSPLPATADEARAVGDLVLLGAKATEGGLRKALVTHPRWRAVHLACHGLIDPERPSFSALALTPASGSDGFLTAIEVLRMRVPADLVVLSACETGRGRIYAGEGILGLTRAFMLAGSPRVLVSLWRVDDRATRVLMEKFYEVWKKGGVDAIAALAAAQEHVRTLEKTTVDKEASRKAGRDVYATTKPYADPRYWAAWVLWGLPR